MEIYPQATPFGDPTKGRGDESTLAILVSAAEPLVRDFRARYDTSARDGMPAHITIIWPFMHPHDLTGETIERIGDVLARSEPFTFGLTGIGHFNSQALYLRPEPDSPIRTLISEMVAAFPDFPPYGGAYGDTVAPHLTVAQVKTHQDFKQAEAEFRELADGALPIAVGDVEISLMERRAGLWRQRRVFALG